MARRRAASKAAAASPRSYASKADYPCTSCGGKPLSEVASAAPDSQSEFDCPDCGLHHVVANSRFEGEE